MRRDLLFLYTHSHFLSIRDVVHSNRQAPGGCAVVCMALGPDWAHPKPCLEPEEIWSFKATLFFVFFCLSNASSSEAMFLLKPLKELRAKRKGTHLCCVCVCVSAHMRFPISLLRCFHFSWLLSSPKTSFLSFSCWIVDPVCLFCCCLLKRACWVSSSVLFLQL